MIRRAREPTRYAWNMGRRRRITCVLVAAGTLVARYNDTPRKCLGFTSPAEVVKSYAALQSRLSKTVVFVTHSIAEAVYLSDQVLVFSRRPARIAERIVVDLPYPRSAQTRFSQRFAELAQAASRALGVLH